MSRSFDRIDYTLRPAKYVERRMLRDIFRRVAPFDTPEDYVYVGFGSVWFADFILFHRALGVRDMISIESSTKAKDRVADNAPFAIDLRFARSERVLPHLDWTRHQFIWLDYDDAIDPNKLIDCDIVATNARSGTLFAASLRADAASQGNMAGTPGSQIKDFVDTFGADAMPAGLFDEDLLGWPFAELSRTMLEMRIEAALAVRNGLGGEPVSFQPICSFNYADGIYMTTLVGMFVTESENDTFARCGFEKLDFIPSVGATIKIDLPIMTPREIARIEAQLPLAVGKSLNLGSVPLRHADRLEKLYRHLPNYMVAEN